MLLASSLDFIVGTAFGATVAIVSAYVVMRRWALADLRRVMDVVHSVAGAVARRSVASLVPQASERGTVDLKPGMVPPPSDRPTCVYSLRSKTRRPRMEVCVDDVRSATQDESDVKIERPA